MHYTGLYLAHILHCPIILFSPIGFASHFTRLVGNVENPSYQVQLSMTFVEPMTFAQRLGNSVVYYGEQWSPYYEKFVLPVLKEKEAMSYEDYLEVHSNISLILQCSHFVTHNSQVLLANVVDIGGIHCRPGKELPQDLKEFMDSKTEGVVYVSFGSAVKPSAMSGARRQVFLDAFKQIKNPIIWKWDEDKVENLPSNVRLAKWVPQQDLLAHPNLKAFVTHGGLLSTQEAIYHGTPLVGVPLGNDQVPNILRAQKNGYAIMLDWSNITSTGLYKAIENALSNETMQVNVGKMRTLFLDQKETPVERAVWWVEYVIRHNGADFLKPKSMSLRWYEYYLLDVILFLLLVCIVVMVIAIKCCLCCGRWLCRSQVKEKLN